MVFQTTKITPVGKINRDNLHDNKKPTLAIIIQFSLEINIAALQ